MKSPRRLGRTVRARKVHVEAKFVPQETGTGQNVSLTLAGIFGLVIISVALTWLALQEYNLSHGVEPWIAASLVLVTRELAGMVSRAK